VGLSTLRALESLSSRKKGASQKNRQMEGERGAKQRDRRIGMGKKRFGKRKQPMESEPGFRTQQKDIIRTGGNIKRKSPGRHNTLEQSGTDFLCGMLRDSRWQDIPRKTNDGKIECAAWEKYAKTGEIVLSERCLCA